MLGLALELAVLRVATGEKIEQGVTEGEKALDGAEAAESDEEATSEIPEIHFGKDTPEITGNMREAQSEGQDMVLHRETSPDAIRANRAANRAGWKGSDSMEEFPFASTKEGGAGAKLKGVPVSEQRIQGGKLSSFYQKFNIGGGDPFRVVVDDE